MNIETYRQSRQSRARVAIEYISYRWEYVVAKTEHKFTMTPKWCQNDEKMVKKLTFQPQLDHFLVIFMSSWLPVLSVKGGWAEILDLREKECSKSHYRKHSNVIFLIKFNGIVSIRFLRTKTSLESDVRLRRSRLLDHHACVSCALQVKGHQVDSIATP